MVGEIIGGVFIGLLIVAMIYREIQDDKMWREWERYETAHRHCVKRPYKQPRG